MGVIYYLAREDNRTLFEIGKFSEISDLFRDPGGAEWLPCEVPPEPDLRVLIRAAIDDVKLRGSRDEYATTLAATITAFVNGHPVCLLNDCDSNLDPYRFPDDELNVVGSVYSKPADHNGGTSKAS